MARLWQVREWLLRPPFSACLCPRIELRRLILRLDRSVVINLPRRERAIPRAGERLRQRHMIFQRLHIADARHEPVDARARRPQPGEQTGARRIAQRCLAVRVREKCAALCEAIDVRRLDLGMPAEAADPVVLIVNGDEEDVWLRGRIRCGKLHGKKSGEYDEGEEETVHRGADAGWLLSSRHRVRASPARRRWTSQSSGGAGESWGCFAKAHAEFQFAAMSLGARGMV